MYIGVIYSYILNILYIFYFLVQTLKAKWKGLRDNFRVEFKRIPRDENGMFMIPPEEHQSKWTHYKSLLFLSNTL